ncbi:hypothetical protein GWR56_10735 [Mucilaginibacter sp. 14171R-50]|uniref:hypothetical protein n=1 Tax=Mucilaginibacter sp. 14171R-50 TaxID=2703789 RepID=UPI00138C36E7|nr:hypothetical protein [Mucilaginibacter sp. 14171R-50]QHS55986.1 hypothetical protein GWR56_10735 [Mucilaginibacter sp. 14171R-50]
MAIIGLVAAYGLYCRKRYISFLGTGRVTDIQTWELKATLSWIATSVLVFAMIIPLIIE